MKGPLKILVVAGGTRQPIDGVRMLANASTGHTGCVLAETFYEKGHQVYALWAQSAIYRPKRAAMTECHSFDSYDDLKRELFSIIKEISFDVIIMAAAVSDFAVESNGDRAKTKISSDVPHTLKLTPLPKLIDNIKEISPNSKLVAFKLTCGVTQAGACEAVQKVLRHSLADFVVHNDRSDWLAKHPIFGIFNQQGELVRQAEGPKALAQFLLGEVTKCF